MCSCIINNISLHTRIPHTAPCANIHMYASHPNPKIAELDHSSAVWLDPSLFRWILILDSGLEVVYAICDVWYMVYGI